MGRESLTSTTTLTTEHCRSTMDTISISAGDSSHRTDRPPDTADPEQETQSTPQPEPLSISNVAEEPDPCPDSCSNPPSPLIWTICLFAVDSLATLAAIWGKASGITSSPSGAQGAYARVSRCTRAIASKLNELWARRCDLVTKLIVLLTLVIAALALWPTFAGLREGKMATSLAEWTARKDYFEFCESHGWQLPGCDVIRDEPPGPPPALDSRGTGAAKPLTERPELYTGNSLDLPAVYLVFLAASGIVVSSRSRLCRRHLRKLARFLMKPRPDEFRTRAILTPPPALVDFQPPGLGQEHAGSAGPLPISFGTSSSFEFSFGSTLPASPAVITTAIDDSGNNTLRQRILTHLGAPPPLPPPRLIPIKGPQNLVEYIDLEDVSPTGDHYLHQAAQPQAHLMHDHGEKPSYLCVHEGCERSRPGHGFPRSWYLRDHLLGIHENHGRPAQDISAAAPTMIVTGTARARGRKRKSEIQEGEPKSRSISSTEAAAEPPRLAWHTRNTELDAWSEQQRSIQHFVRGAGELFALQPGFDSSLDRGKLHIE